MATELVLIRHGHALRVDGDYHDAPLTKIGREQAERTGQFLSNPEHQVDMIYASPLRRAQETARIIASVTGQEVVTRPGIEEARYPEVILLLTLELLSVVDPLDAYLVHHAGKQLHWPVEGRVSRVLLDIIRNHPNQRVGVVAHAGVISASLSWFLPRRRWHWWRTNVGNCSFTRFKVEDSSGQLLVVNDIKHLTPALASDQPPAVSVEIAEASHPPDKNLGLLPPAPKKEPAEVTLPGSHTGDKDKE